MIIDMPNQPLFSGLVTDENDNPVESGFIGNEPCYIVNDAGFRRHIPSEQVDRQVLSAMSQLIEGNEEAISQQATKMLGQDDLFTHAFILNQIKNLDKQFDTIIQSGIPEDVRAYMGMMGFNIKINIHGDVIEVNQPGMIDPNDE
jgi:hypothetical protein